MNNNPVISVTTNLQVNCRAELVAPAVHLSAVQTTQLELELTGVWFVGEASLLWVDSSQIFCRLVLALEFSLSASHSKIC